jgi:hypothetical protein
MSGDIFLNIDSVVLRGLGPVDRQALTVSLRQALITQLSSNSAFTATELSRARTAIRMPATYNAEQLGQMLGRSIGGLITNRTHAGSTTDTPKRGGPRDA